MTRERAQVILVSPNDASVSHRRETVLPDRRWTNLRGGRTAWDTEIAACIAGWSAWLQATAADGSAEAAPAPFDGPVRIRPVLKTTVAEQAPPLNSRHNPAFRHHGELDGAAGRGVRVRAARGCRRREGRRSIRQTHTSGTRYVGAGLREAISGSVHLTGKKRIHAPYCSCRPRGRRVSRNPCHACQR